MRRYPFGVITPPWKRPRQHRLLQPLPPPQGRLDRRLHCISGTDRARMQRNRTGPHRRDAWSSSLFLREEAVRIHPTGSEPPLPAGYGL
jgi:hypothetical protein